jgi:hypothetical protein
MASNTSSANIWKFSFFRSLGGLFKATPRTQRCYSISEEGIIRRLDLPMATGWATDIQSKLSWAVIHKLKVRIRTEKGVEDALFISDRSYVPLDPTNALAEDEKKRLIPLKEIAASKYNQAESTCQSRTQLQNAHKLLTTVFYSSICITAVVVLIVLVKAKMGGH